jgi:C1A family cysteine protease/uncharacterized protein YjdB
VKTNRISKKVLSVMVIATLFFSTILFANPMTVKADPNQSTLSIGQVNPELTQYLKGGVKGYGLVPAPVKITNSKAGSTEQMATALPTSYDLRTVGTLTPVRDQGQIGSCWTFGTYASLESNMLTTGLGQQDYSENNLMTHHGFDLAPDDGGNMFMSTAYLARWDGPVNESADPYPNPPTPANVVVRNGVPVQKHVQDIVFIPDRTSATDNTDIKNAVMQYGALYTSMGYYDNYFKSSTNAYYDNAAENPSTNYANHAVSIVGWDDNYSKSNFNVTAPGNGAYIIRNSWGSSWGISGYFYVSYYDTFIGKENGAFTNAQVTNNYDKVYQYDPLGFVDQIGFSSPTAWFGNVFTSTGNDSLSATSFYTTQKAAQYQIFVETDYATNRFTKLVSVKSGTIDMPGYHTIILDTPVALTSGKSFAVVVKLTETNETNPIAIEEYYSGYSGQATASTGQSFTSSNGTTWTDLMVSQPSLKANVCLKAFTKNGTVTVPVTGVTLDKTSLSMNTGTQQTLTATVAPSNATNKNVTWTSSNTAVASVASGVVTANAAGTAVITVTTVDGAKTATCTVTVTNATGLTSIDEGFDSVVGTSSSITSGIPAGWTFTSGLGVYTTTSNYGKLAPSIKFQATGHQIVTPTFTLSAPATFTFWIKGQGVDTSSHLLVEKYDGTSWTTVADISSLPTTGTTKSYTLAQSTKQVRFTYTKSVGNLAFDDVYIK